MHVFHNIGHFAIIDLFLSADRLLYQTTKYRPSCKLVVTKIDRGPVEGATWFTSVM